MSNDNKIKQIDKIISDSKANIEFANNYLSTGEADFGNAPESISKSKEIIGSFAGATTGAIIGGGIASSVAGATIGSSILATSTLGLTLGGTMLTPIGLVVAPVLLGGAIGASVAIKNHLKKRKIDIETQKMDLQLCISNISDKYNSNCQKAVENQQKYYEKIQRLFNDFKEKAKDAGKKVAITLDDATHTNVNKRIKQYQEIVLKQYERQNELDQKLYDVACEYKRILEENKLLIEENNKLMAILQGLGKSKSEIDSLLKA